MAVPSVSLFCMAGCLPVDSQTVNTEDRPEFRGPLWDQNAMEPAGRSWMDAPRRRRTMQDTTVFGVPCARQSAAIVRHETAGNAPGHADDDLMAADLVVPVAAL